MADQRKLDELFMRTAQEFAALSTCIRLKVGAVITKNNRIISTGYNGTPAGIINCNEINNKLDFNNEQDRKLHHLFSSQMEIHAEMNAILDMAKRGLNPEGATLYTTIAPCKDCAKLVVTAGIKRVVYLEEYDRDKNKINLGKINLSVIDNSKHQFDDIINIIYNDLNGPQIMGLLNPQMEIEHFTWEKEDT